MRGCADQLNISFASPLHKFIKRSLKDWLPENGPHAGAYYRRVIELHAAIEQEKRVGISCIQGTQDCPHVAWVLRRNKRRSAFYPLGAERRAHNLIQARLLLTNNRQ